jgi:RNA polymerase subunit RPABC4/transcription elongation factor Spt4
VLLLAALFILCWVVIMAGSSSLAGGALLVMIAEVVLVFALDRNGVLSLRGRIPLPMIALVQIVLFVAVVFLFYLWMIPYLVVALIDGPGSRAETDYEREKRIAALEGELGIEPVAEGHCSNCGKPLQAGAEFCAYCGTPVSPPLQVCPNCGTRTFPDAKWCPNCGAALPGLPAKQAS